MKYYNPNIIGRRKKRLDHLPVRVQMILVVHGASHNLLALMQKASTAAVEGKTIFETTQTWYIQVVAIE